MTSSLLADALTVSGRWRHQLDLRTLIEAQLGPSSLGETVDIVAIGKAAVEMASAASAILGSEVQRQLIICERASASRCPPSATVAIGEHPVPGLGSWRAGQELVAFLDGSSSATTLFLLSGGASSLCVRPEAPLTLADLSGVWDAAMLSGVDVTTLNRIRAATSSIAGGRVLHTLRSANSQSLIMVDNVVSGARWVASGLTYEYRPNDEEFSALLDAIDLAGSPLGDRMRQAFVNRSADGPSRASSRHVNRVVGEPALLLECAADEAQRRGYRVIDLGSHVQGDVDDVVAHFTAEIVSAMRVGDRFCVVGVGEVTVQVVGTGSGGRCQELAWRMARPMAELGGEGVFVAQSSDGRDFIENVSGAWVDSSTLGRAEAHSVSWSQTVADNDSHTALLALGQLIEGGHTGWNLCDLYVGLFDSSGAR